MATLIIAEKSSVAKAIYPIVGANSGNSNDGYKEGNGYIVSWCMGHLVGLKNPDDYSEEWAANWSFEQLPMIPETWEYKISEDSGKKKQFKVLKTLMKRDDVDNIICATDADREGECIFRYVYHIVGCNKPVKRLWVSSLEESAIKQALANMKDGSEYDNLFNAGESRAKADWLVGMNSTRLFTCRYGGTTLNMGRVQTPTLAMIVKRDNDVKNFVKQKFFTVDIDCGKYTASSAKIDSEEKADEITALCSGKSASVSKVEKEIKTVNPPKLFDLTTLQREANKKYGYTAEQTLKYLQSLYEGKLATYPRTDSQYISDDMEQTALNVVEIIGDVFDFGKVTAPDIHRCINNKKVTGHHAVIPTENIKTADLKALPQTDRNILTLIALRLLCASAAPHKYESVKVEVTCENNLFSASGKTIIENGWKEYEAKLKTKSEDDTKDDSKSLPEINKGDTYDSVKSAKVEHWTNPPKPFTEDTLLSAMEHAGQDEYDEETDKKGLGTPATRAGTIEGLVKHGYVERNKKQITATEKGRNLIEVVPEEVRSPKLTAEWETKLQQIEHGNMSADDFMEEILEFVKKICKEYSSVDNSKNFSNRPVIGKCPRCGKNVVEGKRSYFCESGKEGCGFGFWKEPNVPKGSKISTKAAVELLTKGKTQLKAISKDGKEYTADFKMTDTGTYVNLEYVKPELAVIGKCPNCGAEVLKGKDYYTCKNKCGMIIGKSYGKVLSESQIVKLLSGKQISYTSNDKKTIVLPEAVKNEYQGKTYYQWKTQKG